MTKPTFQNLWRHAELNPCGTARNVRDTQAGTATLTAVLVVALMSVFVAASVARVTTGQTLMNNDYSNSQAFYAAQASLELMTLNFDSIFTNSLTPSAAEIATVSNTTPNNMTGGSSFFTNVTFNQTVTNPDDPTTPTASPVPAPFLISNGPFAGLTSYRSAWQLDTTATINSTTGFTSNGNEAQVHLTRQYYSHEVPIFQFGIFYNGPLDIHPGPNMWFAGRVHSNDNIYVMCGSGSTLNFTNVVTASGQIIRDWLANGQTTADGSWTGTVNIANPAGVAVPLNMESTAGAYFGSAMNMTLNPTSNNFADANDPEPGFSPNNNSTYTAWNASAAGFGGNLQALVPQLILPLTLSEGNGPIELIRRGITSSDYQAAVLGQAVDGTLTAQSRYCNKPGIRITLSDSQAELPEGTGGIRLDGDKTGTNVADTDSNGMRGYTPQAMVASGTNAAYQATRLNGFRLYTGTNYTTNGSAGAGSSIPANRQTWIKVELVNVNSTTQAITTTDVTADFLSLGVTYQNSAGFNIGDSRAIVCMQRYEMLGPPAKVSSSAAGSAGTVNIPITFNGADPAMATNTQLYGLATSVGVPMATVSPSPTTTPVPTTSPTTHTTPEPTTTSLPTVAPTVVPTTTIKGGKPSPTSTTTEEPTVAPTQTSEPTAAPTTTATTTASPTTVPVAYTMLYPLPVHTYFLASNGTGINYVSTGNYSPSLAYSSGGVNPIIYNAQGTASTSPTPFYPGYSAPLELPTSTPTPPADPVPTGLGTANSSIEATEFSGKYTSAGWVATTTPGAFAPGIPGATPITSAQVLPFPIEFFDTREGLFNVNTNATGTSTAGTPVWDYASGVSAGMYQYGNIPKVGIMSGIDINVANLGSFLSGTWDGCFPNGLKSTQVPNNSPGWIVYVSDRRGDRNDDGDYDMEDIYGPLDGVLEPGEDYLGTGVLKVDTAWEAAPFYNAAAPASAASATTGDPNYVASVPSDIGAFFDHQYFRRAVRLINASSLPGGTYTNGTAVNVATPTSPVVGFTVAAENPIYIVGNYNATGVPSADLPNGTAPTAPNQYTPY
ncbi:MAG TPA: pilus assembly PilX N-terminal domain-containing protein, partial [Blastocatellia bacterium]